MVALGGSPRQYRWIAGGTLALVVFAAGAIAIYGLMSADDPKAAPLATPSPSTPAATLTPTATPSASPTPVRWASPLNGVPLTEDEWNLRKDLLPLAVMIDNTPGALPHAGLDRADVVYEAFVEGGITRLMAVYWSQEAERILPVRSARTPFVVWVDELGALYGHAGAAGTGTNDEADAVGRIFEWEILDLNAFTPGPGMPAYFRDAERRGPYDVGTSTAWLREAADRMGYAGPPRVESWQFKADGEATDDLPAAEGVEVQFQERPNAWQTIQWRWDAGSNSYLRFQFGGPFVDALSGEQIRARNVVVMRIPWQVVDDQGHVLLEQFGAGEATVFLDGKAISATWQKTDRRARTRFYDPSGTEIAFNRGPIWIEVAGPASRVAVTERERDLPPLPAYEPPRAPDPEPPVEEPTPPPSPEPSVTSTPSPTPTVAETPTTAPAPATDTPSPTQPAAVTPSPNAP